MHTLLRKIKRRVILNRSLQAIEQAFEAGLPRSLREAIAFIVTGTCEVDTVGVAAQAESRRLQIASEGQRKVPIWYSPKPGSSGTDPDLEPLPGEVMEFTMERIAKTGKDQKWGSVLYLLGKGFRSEYGLELGSCAGISALYLSSIPTMKRLVTVEGSEALSEIAKQSVSERSNVEVLNMRFEEAIANIHEKLPHPIDFAYIDGHHEKVATLHYFNKIIPHLKPGALVIFDDISWSHDMREAWDSLSQRKDFSHTIDLGEVGVCVMRDRTSSDDAPPRHWDLQPIIGRRPIGDPAGWKLS